MGPTNKCATDELQMLGRRDYDLSYSWPTDIPNQQLQSTAVQFISTAKLQFQPPLNQPLPTIPTKTNLSSKQNLALHIILHHHSQKTTAQPLRMIIQGTTGIGKSFLIDYIRQKLNIFGTNTTNTLFVLAPTGIAAYNIQGTTIHAGLRIPIKEMHPLIGKALFTFQECFRHVKYLLIDEMSFLGPKLLLKIDSCLRQAFPDKQHEPFGGLSIILVGDLGQLPPVMDKPAYASHSTTLNLCRSFTIVVTLHTIFRQQGSSVKQQQFRSMLQNIRDAQPNKHDWQMLMNQTNTNFTLLQQNEFNSSIHLFATNSSTMLHNKRMLKALNLPIALSIARIAQQTNSEYDNNEQLPLELLLCENQ
ncbi:uncharacterized protein LOC131856793 [Cryptomeria japonica]|uniref:uncharacterized protein LOC131856793 n=1 Tax=Cryptomeria japonica TaxID=3369 RepID=UPI0027DA6F56|nr:uncharacterized protein LOC131856793 [Cryptomeria japonica]